MSDTNFMLHHITPQERGDQPRKNRQLGGPHILGEESDSQQDRRVPQQGFCFFFFLVREGLVGNSTLEKGILGSYLQVHTHIHTHTRAHTRTHAHTHTHAHTQRERERATERGA